MLEHGTGTQWGWDLSPGRAESETRPSPRVAASALRYPAADVGGRNGRAASLGDPEVLPRGSGRLGVAADVRVSLSGAGVGVGTQHPCWEEAGLALGAWVSLGGSHVGRRGSARVCAEIVGVGRVHAEARVWAKVRPSDGDVRGCGVGVDENPRFPPAPANGTRRLTCAAHTSVWFHVTS